MKCDKTRNRKGQWCLTESAKYKMANHFGQFNKEAEEQFNELASEKYDFATCQRSDGSYYGTSGQCRKGTPVKGPVPKKEKAVANMRAKDLKRRGADGENHGKQVKNSGGGSSSEYRTRPKGAIESDMKKLTSSGAMNQKGTAGVKARKEHAKLKEELNKPLKGANSRSGTGDRQKRKS